jgi:prepilin-type processing-associated H-X9-DG protein
VSDYAAISEVRDTLFVHLGYTTTTFPTIRRVTALEEYKPNAPVSDPDAKRNTRTSVRDILDGTSRTAMVAEDNDRPFRWVFRKITNMNVTGAGWADANSAIAINGTDKATGTATRGDCVINCINNDEIWSFHDQGSNILFCDGAVHFFKDDVQVNVLVPLLTKRGNEVTVDPSSL